MPTQDPLTLLKPYITFVNWQNKTNLDISGAIITNASIDYELGAPRIKVQLVFETAVGVCITLLPDKDTIPNITVDLYPEDPYLQTSLILSIYIPQGLAFELFQICVDTLQTFGLEYLVTAGSLGCLPGGRIGSTSSTFIQLQLTDTNGLVFTDENANRIIVSL